MNALKRLKFKFNVFENKMRLVSFDYFRAIAISMIVTGHASAALWTINSFGEKILASLISGGTALFVFISGFFFHHIFYKKFNFKLFMMKKTTQVFIPYTLLSLLGITYYLISFEPLPNAHELGIDKISPHEKYIWSVAVYLWTGGIAAPYWYIPFIMTIFIASPLFIRYIRLSPNYRNTLFFLLLICAMFIHRSSNGLNPLHSVLYYTPVYMVGIICSIHREAVTEFIRGKSIILGAIVLCFAILQVVLQIGWDGYGNFGKRTMFSYNGIDIQILQKIVMCFFFLSILQKFEDKNLPALNLLASSSFAIFFLHPWFIDVFLKLDALSYLQFLPGLGLAILNTVLVLVSSLLTAALVKLIFKKNSRYITGW